MDTPRTNHIQSSDIGDRLKALRKAYGLSIRVLAEKAGLSPNTISLIESKVTSPTVATLQTIANVMDIPLSAFFTNSEEDEEVVVIRAQEQEKEIAPGLNVSVFPTQVLDRRVRIMEFSIEPGMSSGGQPLLHPGDELVLCLRGELEYIVNDHIYRLKEGDSLAFKANLPHEWKNRSSDVSHFMVLITTETDQSFRSHFLPQ